MFLGYIHYFRALAIFFIVAGHCIDVFHWESTGIERLIRIVFSNGSVLFVFIAGYLFQHLSVNFEAKKYYTSKFKNVLIPYFLISIPAIFVFTFLMKRETVWPGFYDGSILEQIFLFYVTGMHLAPLWFVPMISLFYLCAPILLKADKASYFYLSIPLFILVSCFYPRGLPHQSFVHFFSIYILGMFCSHYKTEINRILSKNYSITILFLFAVFFVAVEYFFMSGTMTYVNFLQKLTASLMFLGLFYKFNNNLSSHYVARVADTSFGVFFIHSYVLSSFKLLYVKFFGESVSGNFLLYFISILFVLLVCHHLILLVKKITGRHSRYLVGS